MLAMVRGSRMHAQMGGSFPTPLDPASRAFLVGGQALLGLQDGPGTSDFDVSCSTVFAMTMATIMHAQMGGPPGVISHPQGPLPPWTLPRGPFWWVVRPS